MRLTCPNCDAQYEVPDDVVPSEGRDVQCSNCGKTWFQHHPDFAPEEEAAANEATPPAPDKEVTPPAEPETEPEIEPQPAPRSEPQTEPQTGEEDTTREDEPPVASPPRKELDPAVAGILREEAEAEQALRRNTSDPLESQPDLGLGGAPEVDEDTQRTLEARKRMARMRGEPEPMSEADVNAAAISSRRDLLPDIEEINSTLRTENRRAGADDQAEIEAPTAKRKKRSFRSGFLLVLLIFAILALVYVFAPQLAQQVPGLDPYLSAYVAWVDGLRLWLDGHAQGALRWLDNLASQSGG